MVNYLTCYNKIILCKINFSLTIYFGEFDNNKNIDIIIILDYTILEIIKKQLTNTKV